MPRPSDRSRAGGSAIVASAVAGAVVGAAGLAWWLLAAADQRRRQQRQQRLLSLSRDLAIGAEGLRDEPALPAGSSAALETRLHDRVQQLNQAIEEVRRRLERLEPQG
ncbi:MAG: hypothetical protein VKJ05_08050 [Synechococcaceae cyanobacterium]|nr:hypothetical protein [Synechococcaceae cyanobacterium]